MPSFCCSIGMPYHADVHACFASMHGDHGMTLPDAAAPQYVVLRRDLWTEMKWPLGSVVAQACHAATAAMWLNRGDEVTAAYLSDDNLDHMHKVSGHSMCCLAAAAVPVYADAASRISTSPTCALNQSTHSTAQLLIHNQPSCLASVAAGGTRDQGREPAA